MGEEPTTHSAVAFRLWNRLVQTGLLERDYARVLSALREAREEGGYTPVFTLSREEAAELVERAGDFVRNMKELLRRVSQSTNLAEGE